MSEFAEALEQLSRGEKADKGRIRQLLSGRGRKATAQRKISTRRRVVTAMVAILITLSILLGAGWLMKEWLLNSPAGQLVAHYLPGTKAAPSQVALAGNTQAAISTAPAIASATRQTPTQTSMPTRMPEPATPAVTAAVPSEATPTATPVAPSPAATPTNIALAKLPLKGTPVTAVRADITAENLRKIALWGIGGVNATVYSPDGKQIALGTSDGIFIFDAATFARRQYIRTDEWVEAILFDAKGETILAALRSGQVLGWNIASLEMVIDIGYTRPSAERIRGDAKAPAKALAYSPNEQYLAIGYENGATSIWKMGKESKTPDHIWDQPHKVTGLAFSEDSRYLYEANDTNAINVWDISTDRMTSQMAASSPISSLVLSKDGSLLAGGGKGSIVHLFDTAKGRTIYSYLSLGAPVTSLALSVDKERVAIGLKNGKVKVFHVPGSGEPTRIQKEIYLLSGHPDAVTGLAFSPDGQTLASSSWREGLKTWEAASGTAQKDLGLSRPDIERMVFSPDSQWLVASSVEGHTQAWNVRAGDVRYEFQGVLPRGVPFSADGKYLVIVREAANGWDDGWLDIIDLPNGKTVITLTGYRPGWQVSFSPNGDILVAGDTQDAYVWDTSTWQKVKMDGGSKGDCSQFMTLDDQLLTVIWGEAIIFKYDNRVETLCATRPTFAKPLFLPTDMFYAIYITDNGKFWSYNMNPNNIQSALIADFYRKGNQAPDDLLAVSADNKFLAYSVENSKVVVTSAVWTNLYYSSYTSSQGPYLFLNRQGDYQYKMAISPDNKIIAAGSRFGTITLWASH